MWRRWLSTLLSKAKDWCSWRVDSISWDTGQITLTALWTPANRYTLLSTGANEPGDVFDYASVDESPSDFVAGTVRSGLAVASAS